VATAITIFLAVAADGDATAWFDDVVLAPVPCCLDDAEPEEPPKPPETRRQCLDWQAEREPQRLPPKFERDGFGVVAEQAPALQVVTFGQPAATGKLLIPPGGVTIVLPFPATEVIARVVVTKGLTIVARAGQTVVGQRTVDPASVPQTVSIAGAGITEVDLDGADHELLVELCAVATTSAVGTGAFHTHPTNRRTDG
jgi:hypothetical protein